MKMKIKNEFTTSDLILIGVTILIAGFFIIGFGFDFMSIGSSGIYFNF